jgi:hypothetical protein
MTALTILDAIKLVPVIELTPGTFSTRERLLPAGSGRDMPEEWDRYWLDCLADSDVVGLTPLRPSSWMVPTRQLTDMAVLSRILSIMIREWGGPEAFPGPDSKPVLDGGLALCSGDEVLVAPICCCDLGNVSERRDAVVYRQLDWKMVWIGHPWLSVRFNGSQLEFSEPHESDSPVAKWTVSPEKLGRAVSVAEAELEAFARRLESVVASLGGNNDHASVARSWAGCPPDRTDTSGCNNATVNKME